MYCLGIETSCDETAAAIVRDGNIVLSNIVASTQVLHKKYGGVIPEIANRGHLEAIDTVVEQAVRKARISLKMIKLIAVTLQPGLPGALLVGNAFARALSFSLGVPLVEIDHTLAHIYAPFLNNGAKNKKINFPFVGLVVSGGHSNLIYFSAFNDYRILGTTRDDAPGEAFDKVAKILGLGYPGGPEIDRLARQVSKSKLHFNCAKLPGTFDFSFSGIKTAILYFVRDWLKKNKSEIIPRKLKVELAYAFQSAVVEVLADKAIFTCKKMGVLQLVVGGGVAANSLLRKELVEKAALSNIKVDFAPKEYCLDNAAMVAGLGYQMRRLPAIHSEGG